MIELIWDVLFYICAIALVGFLYLGFKNENVYKNHVIITRAIFAYKMYCLKEDYKAQYDVNYEDMERYSRTLLRFWDWGYKHILPKDKFEIIKPFIGQEVDMNFASTFEEEKR